MGRITLVCTAHTEEGLCNENELVKILLEVVPDVIFEEIRPADFDSYYGKKSKYTLETRAVTHYLKGRQAQQVPVDDYDSPEGFGPKILALDRFVQSRSPEYCAIIDEMGQMKFQFGFRYLNSQRFVSHVKKSDQLYEEAVFTHGNAAAKEMLSLWNEQVRKRDVAMLENIYGFSRNNPFKEGVFLVGAGHMLAITEGVESRMKGQPSLVAWKFWNRP